MYNIVKLLAPNILLKNKCPSIWYFLSLFFFSFFLSLFFCLFLFIFCGFCCHFVLEKEFLCNSPCCPGTLWTRLALNSQSSVCLCLRNAVLCVLCKEAFAECLLLQDIENLIFFRVEWFLFYSHQHKNVFHIHM